MSALEKAISRAAMPLYLEKNFSVTAMGSHTAFDTSHLIILFR
jgi:hypothetical protein